MNNEHHRLVFEPCDVFVSTSLSIHFSFVSLDAVFYAMKKPNFHQLVCTQTVQTNKTLVLKTTGDQLSSEMSGLTLLYSTFAGVN